MSEPQKFYIFAEDRQVYGPADTLLLQQWAKEGLISPQSWIYHEGSDAWSRAQSLAIVKELLITAPLATHEPAQNASGLKAGQLRRIRLLADMTDQQAEKFVGLVEKVKVRAFSPIVRQGEHGDSMFLILDGEARVSVKTDDKEDTIAMLGVGDFFGEMALLDEGPRSADVTANKDCTLLKLSRKNFEDIMSQNSEIASRFLLAMNRFLGGRIRATNDRFARAQNFARGASGQIKAPSGMQWRKEF